MRKLDLRFQKIFLKLAKLIFRFSYLNNLLTLIDRIIHLSIFNSFLNFEQFHKKN